MATILDFDRLTPVEAATAVATAVDDEWARRFVDELDRRVRTEPLHRIMDCGT